jgi:hypothetical protein
MRRESLTIHPYFHPYNSVGQTIWILEDAPDESPGGDVRGGPSGPSGGSYTIFEGTSEVQRLVIARAISGVHIK